MFVRWSSIPAEAHMQHNGTPVDYSYAHELHSADAGPPGRAASQRPAGGRVTPRKYPNLRRHRPRARTITGMLLSVLLTGGLATATAGAHEKPFADLPPQEPGVTLRVFDIQSPLNELCDLKPAQTPNVDKLIPAADWSSTDGFGFTDNFVSQIIGNIDVPADGTYDFRLISDDGSRLSIGGQQVIDHDGLHGAEPKDGEITLTPGYHALQVDHFDRGGGQQVTLQWKPPGAADFALVPNSVLSTDAGVVRVTALGVRSARAPMTPRRRSPADLGQPRLHPHGLAARRLRAASLRDGLDAGRPACRDHLGRQHQHRGRGVRPRPRHGRHRPGAGHVQEDR
ncbi:PA14 domain-containing protein [Streptomyces sp. M10(2022)]